MYLHTYLPTYHELVLWAATTCRTLYLSNTTSFVLCVFCRVKDHHNCLHSSRLLKRTCGRQAVSGVRQVVPPDLLEAQHVRQVGGDAGDERQGLGAGEERRLIIYVIAIVLLTLDC